MFRPRCRPCGAFESSRLARTRPRRGSCCRPARGTQGDDDLSNWQDFFDSNELGIPEGLLNISVAKEVVPDADGSVAGNCYGCGANLQTGSPDTFGYVDAERYFQKRERKQMNTILCSRCIALTHGHMVPAVEDFSQKQELIERSATQALSSMSSVDGDDVLLFKGEVLLTHDQLREHLKGIDEVKAVVVMIIDILDASGSFLSRVRSLIGPNPVVIVATKADLLPKGTDEARVLSWLQDFVAFKRLNCLSVHLVSNKTGVGFDKACASILSQRVGRDVFIVGAANVGKSAFVRRMLKEMGSMQSRHFDARAVAVKQLPVESAMPGTTLGRVPLAAFSSGGTLYDTPGLHLSHRMPHMLRPRELKQIHPRRRLRPYVAASPYDIAEQNEVTEAGTGNIVPCGSYFWGALLRIDVYEAPEDVRFVFFGTGVMQVYACSLLASDDLVSLDEGISEDELEDNNGDGRAFAGHSVELRGGMRLARDVQLPSTGFVTTIADVCVSGLPGWVAVVGGAAQEAVRMRLWAPRGVEVYVRPPIPCPTPVYIDRMESF